MMKQKTFVTQAPPFVVANARFFTLVVTMVLVLASSIVTANNLEIVVVDYNTLNSIESATVQIYNGTDLIDEGNTNVDGIINFTLTDELYTIVTTKTGYEGDNRDTDLTGDDSILIPLIPFSHDGIIRVRYVDMTGIKIGNIIGSDHELCFYFASNNRLDACENGNQTITLTEQQDYIIRITPTQQDLLNSPENLYSYVRKYTRYFMTLIFLIAIVGVVYYVQKRYIIN